MCEKRRSIEGLTKGITLELLNVPNGRSKIRGLKVSNIFLLFGVFIFLYFIAAYDMQFLWSRFIRYSLFYNFKSHCFIID